MEALAEGLWGLADDDEKRGEIEKAVKCLEAICQSDDVSFYPIIEVKTRFRIAKILLHYFQNVNHATLHLQRSELLLKLMPSFFDLKCRVYSLLSQCYQLGGDIKLQKQVLRKALHLTASAGGHENSMKLWSCNFNSQLANALSNEGDYKGSISALECGYVCATEVRRPELQMFFATSKLHVHLMQWDDEYQVEQAVNHCNEIWESIEPKKRRKCPGLLFYNELLHTFYRTRLGDYMNAAPHVDNLVVAMKADREQTQYMQDLAEELIVLDRSLARSNLHYTDREALSLKQEQIQKWLRKGRRTLEDKLSLAPPPINGEWLPKTAVFALVVAQKEFLSKCI